MTAHHPRRDRFWPWLAALLFPALFHRFFSHTIIFRDSLTLFPALKFQVIESWKAGRLQAWNPYLFLGMPFIGDLLAGYYYPLNVIYLLFNFSAAHRIFILIHYPLAAIFMILFLRGRGLGPPSSLVGGLAFALSGYLISQHGNLPYLIGVAWAPLALCFAGRSLAGRGSRSWAAATGAALAMQILGGEPQSALVTAAMIAIWSVAAIAATGGAGLLRAAWTLGVAAGSSLALSAVQLLPAYETIRASERQGGVSLEEGLAFSYHPGQLLELIWPMPFGTVWPVNNFWGRFAQDAWFSEIPWAVTTYLGLPVVALAALGIGWSRRRFRIGVGFGALGFLLLALGRYTPVYGFLHLHLPLFNWFRYPAKYLSAFSGLMAIGAALGFERLLIGLEENRPAVRKGAAVYIGAVLIGAIAAGLAWPAVLRSLSGFTPGSPVYRSALLHLAAGGIEWAMVNLAAGLLVWLMAKARLSPARGTWLLIALMVLDWYLANVRTMPAGPPGLYDFRSAAGKAVSPGGRPELGRFRVYRDQMSFKDVNPGIPGRSLPDRMAWWERQTLKPDFPMLEGIEDVWGYHGLLPAGGLPLLARYIANGELLDLYNVEYIIAPLAKTEGGLSVEEVYRDPGLNLRVWRLKNARPRAYFVARARRAADDDSAMAMIRAADFTRTVILTAPAEISEPAPGETAVGSVKVLAYESDRVAIECEAGTAGWLVLSDRYYPGWTATVAGRPVAILKANGLARAVRLPAGRHQVVFAFRPASIRIGAAISSLSWLVFWLWGGAAWYLVRRRARADLSSRSN